MKTIAFVTLGCKLNFSESSYLSGIAEEMGYTRAKVSDRPDVVVINTCTVTGTADKQCRQVVRQTRNVAPEAMIIVTGCSVQLHPEQFSTIPGVDVVIGMAEKFKIKEYLEQPFKRHKALLVHSDISEEKTFHASWSKSDRTRCFLKIQDGCDYHCAYCAVPHARGQSRSDTIQGVLDHIKIIEQTDIHEIILTGVNIGDFGTKNGESFLDLLIRLDNECSVSRIRISSIEPNLLNQEIIQLVSVSKRIMPHFHIPLQSGSDKVLQRMGRRYNTALFEERISLIHEFIPAACIAVDVIAGHPGETEEDFSDCLSFIKKMNVSSLHVFPYSERENTRAVQMPDSVPPSVRSQRSRDLRALSTELKNKFYQNNIGTKHTVLWESRNDKGFMYGFTENYLKVMQPFQTSSINQITEVTIKTADGECCTIDAVINS